MYTSSASPAGMTSLREPRTVTEVSYLIRSLLEHDPLLGNLVVTGEVADLRQPRSGHSYFTLRDKEAALRCVLFKGGRGTRHLDEGAQVICEGRAGLYVNRGDLQIVVSNVEPSGTGALQAALNELRAKLASEGLFDASRKRRLPRFPKRVAVITSPHGAVIQDITNVIRRRFPLLELVLIPAAVQGENSPTEIIEAFADLDVLTSQLTVDAVILARGGGSLEDLMPFNDEMVARTIFASQTPVISGVGHEIDHTIADLVADVRAPTPSAAAEIVSPDSAELMNDISTRADALRHSLGARITSSRQRFELTCDRLSDTAIDTAQYRAQVELLLERGGRACHQFIEWKHQSLARSRAELSALSPTNVLRRGYSIARLKSKDRAVITRASQVSKGDLIDLTLALGTIKAQTVASSEKQTS